MGEPKASVGFHLGDRYVDAWGNDVDEEVAEVETPDNQDYDSWKGDQLVAELKRRNADRDEDHQIVPDGKKKSDVAAALKADDTDSDGE